MKKITKFMLLALVAVSFLAAKPLMAGEKETFTPYTTIVEADVVKQIVDGKAIGIVIDARPKVKKYDKGHIPGALSMPTSQFDKMKGLLPADKGALIVFYCGGLKCALSHKNAFKAEKLGYTNVKVFAKGYPNWKKTYGAGVAAAQKKAPKKAAVKKKYKAAKEEGSIDFDEFNKIVAQAPDSVLFVDVRDPKEFKSGAFKNAVNIPTEVLEKKLPTLKADKPIIYVCGTGARSGEAYYMTLDKRPDIVEVYYVDGEMTWDEKGGYKLAPPK
jgi:rhodanese-related sulfurtransferase